MKNIYLNDYDLDELDQIEMQ